MLLDLFQLGADTESSASDPMRAALDKTFKGTFGLVFGTALTTIIGQRHTYMMTGGDIRLVFDPLDALLDRIADIPGLGEIAGPMLQALGTGANGIGGSVAALYGRNTTLTYGGPQMGITRCPVYSYATGGLFAASVLGTADINALEVPIRTAVLAMSLLMLATIMTLNIVIYQKYIDVKTQPPPTPQDLTVGIAQPTTSTQGPYGQPTYSPSKTTADLPRVLSDLCYTIVGQILGLIAQLEEALAKIVFAKGKLKDAQNLDKSSPEAATKVQDAETAYARAVNGLHSTVMAVAIIGVVLALIDVALGVAGGLKST